MRWHGAVYTAFIHDEDDDLSKFKPLFTLQSVLSLFSLAIGISCPCLFQGHAAGSAWRNATPSVFFLRGDPG